MRSLLILLVCCSTAFAQVGLRNPSFVAHWSGNTNASGGGGGGSPALQTWGSTNYAYVTSPYTISCTIGGDNRLLIVATGLGEASPDTEAVTGMTWNGVALSKLWGTNSSDWVRGECWCLTNPATGTQNLVISTAGASPDQFGIIWLNVTNAHQTAPFGTVATASGTSTAPSVTASSATSRLVIAGIVSNSGASLTASAGVAVTTILNIDSDISCGVSTNAGAASVQMSWTTANESFATGAVGIAPP